MAKVAVAEVSGVDARLAAAFEVLAESPDGVARMRELVLSLAVRGELVPQNGHEDSAPKLGLGCDSVQRVGSTSGRAKPTAALGFTVPKSWQARRLEEVACSITDGDHLPPPREEQGIPFLVIGDIFGASAPFRGSRFVSREYFGQLDPARQPEEGDLLYSVAGTIGQVARVPRVGQFCVQRHIAIIRPGDVGDWLLCFLRSPVALAQARLVATGIAQKTVPLSGLRAMAVPLPPQAEQRRIVARVDELMAWIDQFEAARNQREAARIAARDACLATLCAATNPTEVAAAWSTLSARFDSLFTAPEDVGEIRQSILELAVLGRLVPQDSADEHAAPTIRGANGGVLSNVESGVEIAVPVPRSWTSCRLGDLVQECRNGVSKTPNDDGEGVRVLRISAATGKPRGIVDLDDARHVVATEQEVETFSVKEGDLLVCRFNGNLHFVGRAAVVPRVQSGPVLYPDKLIRLRANRMEPSYLTMALGSRSCRAQVESMAATTAGNLGINGGQLKSVVVNVPPLAEQRRIVARADELMAVCDQLEAALLSTQAGSQAVASSVLASGVSAT